MNIVISDLDGTIVVNKAINKICRTKIEKFCQSKSNRFIIASGREPLSFQEMVEEHELTFFDYAVLANGAYIVNRNGDVLLKKQLKGYAAQNVLDEIVRSVDYVKIYIAGEGFQKSLQTKEETITFIEQDLPKVVNQIIGIAIELPTNQLEIVEKYMSLLKKIPDISVSRNSVFIDINCGGVSKQSGIRWILDHEELSDYSLYTIGDGENDISMLKMTENSFTFRYAEEKVQSHAKYIVNEIGEMIDRIIKKKSN